MYSTFNLICSRLSLLGLVLLFALSMSACQLFLSEPEEEPVEAMEEAEPVEMMEEPEPLVVADDVHVVATGESLWRISGMTSIYNDSFRWPLIYSRNKDIEDADLIFPGQELAVPRDLTRDAIDAAVTHAKNRGSWSIGEIEESDVQFRNNSM